jgi:hypothetical protein
LLNGHFSGAGNDYLIIVMLNIHAKISELSYASFWRHVRLESEFFLEMDFLCGI